MLSGAGRLSGSAMIVLMAVVLIAANGSRLSAQERTGRFHIVYVDPLRARRPPAPQYGLVDAQGRWTPLAVDDAVLRAAGGARALESRMVTVSGAAVAGAAPVPGLSATATTLRVSSLRSLEPAAAPGARPAANAAAEAKRYVMLLCKFSDRDEEPKPRGSYDVILGPTRPNLTHYYDEMSYGRVSFAGSVAVGWFRLPKPYLHYYPNGSQSLQFSAILNDCTAAADATVDFTQYAGIIVQHNSSESWAYGGRYTLTLDGQTRVFGVAWMPTSGPATLAHEIGHTLGFPHSSGGYDAVYDSRWDVMSNSYPYWDTSLSPPDWLQQHTIAYNKWWAGWIDGARQLVPSLPSTQSVMLLHGARPPATPGYQLIRVADPVVQSKQYLAEARRRVGYDQGVPGDAVVLHSYDQTRAEPAQVIDVDRNSDPNDAGAMWTPGESYADSVVGFTVDVDSMNASGFGVTVVRGWRLRMQATGPGSINGAPTGACTAQCDHVATTRGTTVTLSAQPSAGAQFLGWTGACSGTGTCAVTLAGNRVVGARFAMPVTLSSAPERPRAIVGRPYEDKLVATGGLEPITWAVASGSLPPGLALAAGTGVLSGQPTNEGRFEFTVRATSGQLNSTRAFVIVAVRPVAIVTEASLPRAVAGTSYSHSLAAQGGVGSVSWSISSGALPTGLSLESTTGTLAGTPTVAGSYQFAVLAASDTLRDTRTFTLNVAAPVAITSAIARRGAVMGAPYADTVRASGGDGAFEWRLVSGALPAGVTFEPGGVLRGTPTASGTFRFVASATSDGLSAQHDFEVAVGKPTILASAVIDLLLGGSSPLSADERNFLDLLGNRNGRVDLGDVRAWLVDIGALPAGAPSTESMSALTGLREQQSRVPSPTTTRNPDAADRRDARP